VVPTRIRVPTDEERALELLAIERQVRRDMVWVYGRAVLACVLSSAIGLFMIAWSVHSTNQQTAPMFFWGGLLAGNAGILVTLAITWHRALQEGWL
jgi:hypothetical protein